MEAAAHFGEEGGTGAITGSRLAAHPSPRFGLTGATENAQDGDRDEMVDTTTVFRSTDILGVLRKNGQ